MLKIRVLNASKGICVANLERAVEFDRVRYQEDL